MQTKKEISIGIILTVLLVCLFSCVHNRSVHHHDKGRFVLNATFNKADGLMPMAEVRLAGIRVGQIGEQKLSMNGHQVIVQLVFDKPVDIPLDSSVSIETDGIMGSKHIEIVPGGDEEIMISGDSFSYTQDSLILTELLDKVNAYMREKKENQSITNQEDYE